VHKFTQISYIEFFLLKIFISCLVISFTNSSNNNNNDNSKMQNNEVIDEWTNWIEEAIIKKHIKYYEYENFKNIQEIGCGAFGKVFRANWKNFDNYLALKSFFNLNKITLKEIVHEVIKNLFTYF
jgi:hypothetical protein